SSSTGLAFRAGSNLIINGRVETYRDNTFHSTQGNINVTLNAGGVLEQQSGATGNISGLLTLNGGTVSSTGTESSWGSWKLYKVNITADSTINAASIRLGNDGYFDVADGVTLTMNTVIGNNDNGGSFIKKGTGTINLTKSSTNYTGQTIVEAGTLNFAVAKAIIGPITVKEGGVLRFSVGEATGYSGTMLTKINLEGGILDIQNASGNQTFTGVKVTMTGGTITGISGKNIDLMNNSTITVIGSDKTSVIENVKLGLRQDTTTFDVSQGTSASGVDLNITSVLAPGSYQPETHAQNLVKTGDGTMRISSLSTYTGTTTVAAGTLELNAGGANGAIQGTVNVETGATLRFLATDSAGYSGRKITELNLNGGTLDIATTSSGGNQAFSTTLITMTGGKITGIADRAVEFTDNVAVATNSSSQTSVIENITLKILTNTTFAVAAGTTSNGVDLEISSRITPGYGSPAVGITKTGTGTMLLSGTNTYTGATIVNEGKLLINGNNSSATGLVTVNTGATLGGSGTIGGDIVIEAGGFLAPGNSIGTLNANGNVSLKSGATLVIEINSSDGATLSSSDQLLLAAGKNIDFESGANLQLVFTDQAMDSILVSDIFGTLGDYSSLINATITGNGSAYQFNGSHLTAIPEPSTYALFGAMGGLALVMLRRRKKSSH
ncbi:MAG: autotransporter-associated beta strand repeat-containing protein, partial [Puniceicoccales bacterium]|nr:autotransporter-associated beta strand repeat-containing protein [Puniceicoccales bacterium]